mmetsp:Transcript_54112/g.129350  ORF Transcript_54112/g.129350 Transcript_54112/m.129350 type:complete len:80 (-) Transcript_54112:172-411(-)
MGEAHRVTAKVTRLFNKLSLRLQWAASGTVRHVACVKTTENCFYRLRGIFHVTYFESSLGIIHTGEGTPQAVRRKRVCI